MIIQSILNLKFQITPLLKNLNDEEKKEVIAIYENLNKLEKIIQSFNLKN